MGEPVIAADWRPMVEMLDERPDDIPETDWRNIVRGSAFARAVGSVSGDEDGKDADAWLDYAGEIEQALQREGYVVIEARGAGRREALTVERLAEVLHERYGEYMQVCDGFRHDECGYWQKEADAIVEALGWRAEAAAPLLDRLARLERENLELHRILNERLWDWPSGVLGGAW